jgi:hypothetical protein
MAQSAGHEKLPMGNENKLNNDQAEKGNENWKEEKVRNVYDRRGCVKETNNLSQEKVI